MTPEDQLARNKLAIETRLKRKDQDLALKQYELSQAQFEWQKKQNSNRGLAWLISPTGVVILGAALGLIGTAAGKWADYRATRKQEETTIILKASEVPQSLSAEQQDKQRARNLLFFANARYLDLPSKSVERFEHDAGLDGKDPGAPVFQSGASTATFTSAFDIFKAFDAPSPKVYLDQRGVKVIGYGHVLTKEETSSGKIVVGDQTIPFADGISQFQAKAILDSDLIPCYQAIDTLVKVPLTTEQRDALVSFVFENGVTTFKSSTLLTTLNQGRYKEFLSQLSRFPFPGGRLTPGLQRRRAAEADLWNTDPRNKR